MAALRVNFFAAAFLVVLSVDLCAAAPVNDTKSSHNNPDSAGSRENTKAKGMAFSDDDRSPIFSRFPSNSRFLVPLPALNRDPPSALVHCRDIVKD